MSCTYAEAKRLFEYLDSSSAADHGYITLNEIRTGVGVDLDGDGIVSNKPLYRKRYEEKSPYTQRMMVCFKYRNVPGDGYEPYMIELDGQRVQATEQMLRISSEAQWVRCFEEAFKDDQMISEKEFMDIVMKH